MQRVVIIGGGGSGKSTLAQQLGSALNLPVYHLDRFFWRPGWEQSTWEEFDPQVRAIAEQDRWVIDGNYSRTLPDRLARADTVVFLDLPLRVRLWRVLKRRFHHHGQVRADIGEGCPEQIDWIFFKQVVRYQHNRRIKALKIIDDVQGTDIRVFHLRSVTQVRSFLDEVTAPSRSGLYAPQ
jgi:adenylate kinase family enzyme